jgi:HSP20 family protein
MNRLFEDATERRTRDESTDTDNFERADWTPAADVYETETGYEIAIDLPGVSRDAVEIDLDDNRLVIKGNRILEQSTKHRSERRSGKFLRAFTVPGLVDQTKITAEYKNGVLQLRLPKRTEPKPQKVEIKIT